MRPVAVMLVAAAMAGPAPALAAPPDGACRSPGPTREVVAPVPWTQQLLDLKNAWTHSTGAGVTVAVVDSGVDADHPQLRGKVLSGRDFVLPGAGRGDFDCASHGTAVASIIAASAAPGVGFRGIAPDARVLPVRVTEREFSDSGDPIPLNPDAVANGIRFAADQGVKVINLSLSGYGDYTAIRDAVAYAQSKDVLVVAAVGNRAELGLVASYPASYDGVLGVGSIDIEGARSRSSQTGAYVDLVAPGEDVLAAAGRAGHNYWQGTSFAAPVVAGTAALVRSRWPDLPAPQVAARIVATADPARGGRGSAEYGAGVVDPYRAVTERLTDSKPAVVPAVVPVPPDPVALREAAWWSRTGWAAKAVAGLVLLGIAVAAVVFWALPRGRRRRWLPGRAEPVARRSGRGEPPDEIFLFPVGE
ncbi:type VII secretion-associated serine protease mycosin [Nocardia sp. NRRL S-836]|uniref:type VII secretion-associated serine protease mycosin n=1 Tax=Nocardia sp. NRRL S-836 TaxID=1519492 RepID=UPI0006AE6025|nr:type VII secretion-associated serine protease mycosin [Nocardia sp. NRRL S-836]KOV87233.1 peptidase S8 [Nocardia sp. NRRL S-836]